MREFFPWLLAAVLVTSACEKTGEPVPVATPVPSPTVTETFSGTLQPFGSSQHLFQIAQNSEVWITVTTLTTVPVQADPNANPPIVGKPAVPITYSVNVRIGQQAITTLGIACSALKSVVAPAGADPQIKGKALAGTFCVAVSDPAGATPDSVPPLPEPVNYVVTVAHS